MSRGGEEASVSGSEGGNDRNVVTVLPGAVD